MIQCCAMAGLLLNATLIESLKLPPGLDEKFFSDGGGLYLRLRAGRKGVAKDWYFRYTFHGERPKFAFGAYPAISLAEARQLAKAADELLAKGLDPKAEKNESSTKPKRGQFLSVRVPFRPR